MQHFVFMPAAVHALYLMLIYTFVMKRIIPFLRSIFTVCWNSNGWNSCLGWRWGREPIFLITWGAVCCFSVCVYMDHSRDKIKRLNRSQYPQNKNRKKLSCRVYPVLNVPLKYIEPPAEAGYQQSVVLHLGFTKRRLCLHREW